MRNTRRGLVIEARLLPMWSCVCLIMMAITAGSPCIRAQEPRPQPELVASTEANLPEQERALFRLPPGFEAQLVACEPDIAKPMNLAFDDMGRLWVTSSYEYPWPVEQGKPCRDKVTILSDFAPDGRARKVTTFAEGLNIPIGVLPLTPRDAFVHCIPNIYHMIDEDGDGKADFKDLFYGSIGYRDTHGMASAFTWGFDGWIYGCHGFANDSTVAGRDGQAVHMISGNTYRLKPNGQHIEQFTWGQVNPFGLTFDPLGNLYSVDCHTRPIFQLLRGAHYDSFGKPHDGLGYGPEMMKHDHYSTGIAGICYYAADAYPKAYQDTIFTGNVVTSRINRDRLEWHGSSPWAVAEDDFLKSDDPWFRPVDIELGPDGNLYVADFYNCIIGHYEVDLKHPRRDRERGRIWRIVYKGNDAKATPAPHGGDLEEEAYSQLVDDLGHPNLAVRIRAANLLVSRPFAAATDLLIDAKIKSRVAPTFVAHAMWVLHRMGELSETELLRYFQNYGQEAPLVRVHAVRILAEIPVWSEEHYHLAYEALTDTDPLVRRCVADAIGQHPAPRWLKSLIELREMTDDKDSHGIHVIRMALRNQFRDGAGFKELPTHPDWHESELRVIADVMPGVHTPESARWLLGYLKKGVAETPENITRYEQTIARYGDDELTGKLVEFAKANDQENRGLQAAQLRSIHRGLQERGGPLPAEARAWAVSLADRLLGSNVNGERSVGAELAGEFRLAEMKEALALVARDRTAPEDQRLKAFQSLMSINADDAVAPLGAVLLEPNDPIGLREQAANLLGQSGRKAARALLLDALPKVPTRLHAPIAAAIATDRGGAEALLSALKEGKASPRLVQEPPVAIRLNASNLPGLAHQLAELTSSLPPADEAAQELVQRKLGAFARAKHDAERGAAVFKKHCAACHQLANEGAKVGPQLDGVGMRGAERLLEDILDPNRNVDQTFRATTLALDDGRVLTGLVLRDPGEVIVLADAQGKEISVPKGSVEERTIAPLSPMPANLAEQISEPELNDLIAYLLSNREKSITP